MMYPEIPDGTGRYLPEKVKEDTLQFNVFKLEDFRKEDALPLSYGRQGFYKISLIHGRNRYHYSDKSITIEGSTLMFFNPLIPYTWESLSADKTGYFCIFRASFFTRIFRSNMHQLPMYQPGGHPGYSLTQAEDRKISNLFRSMMEEHVSAYPFKHDLIRIYITEIIHTALKILQAENKLVL